MAILGLMINIIRRKYDRVRQEGEIADRTDRLYPFCQQKSLHRLQIAMVVAAGRRSRVFRMRMGSGSIASHFLKSPTRLPMMVVMGQGSNRQDQGDGQRNAGEDERYFHAWNLLPQSYNKILATRLHHFLICMKNRERTSKKAAFPQRKRDERRFQVWPTCPKDTQNPQKHYKMTAATGVF